MSNYPLRAGKGWLYEGGIREPLIVHVAGGRSSRARCSAEPVSRRRFLPHDTRSRRA